MRPFRGKEHKHSVICTVKPYEAHALLYLVMSEGGKEREIDIDESTVSVEWMQSFCVCYVGLLYSD